MLRKNYTKSMPNIQKISINTNDTKNMKKRNKSMFYRLLFIWNKVYQKFKKQETSASIILLQITLKSIFQS